MSDARRDNNYITTLMGVDLSTLLIPTPLVVDESNNRLMVSSLITGTVTITQPSTPTVTTVGDTITSTQLIASNTSRKEVEFYNGSSAILYLLKGTGTASATNYTVQLNQGDYYSSDVTSAFQGVWSADSGGGVLVTEST